MFRLASDRLLNGTFVHSSCEINHNVFAVFGLDKIWGVYDTKWTKLFTKESFYSSAGYILGEKKA